MNPQELYEAYMSVYESDDRREMRRLASQERQAEKKAEQDFRKNTPVGGKKSGPKLSATKMSKKEGENFAKQTMNDAEYIAKKAKGHTVGNPFPEEFDYFDQVLSELIDAGYTAEEALEYMVQEAEGSYGQTPRARAAMGKLAVSRMNKPASEYSQRGEKSRKVKAAEKHTRRQDRLASGNNRYGSRGPMDQSRRNWSRGADDYGHTGYDGEGYGGSVTKNPKKLRKQKAMGEIKESCDAYDFVLSYLLDEGFASTEYSADKIILNMSEAWFEDIMELNRYEKETGKDYKTGRKVEKGGTMGGDDTNSKVMRHMHKVMGAGRMGAGGAIQERGKKKDRTGKVKPEGPAVSPAQKVAKRREDKKRGEEMMHSRYD